MKRIISLVIISFFFLNTYAQLPGNSLQMNADGNFVSVPDAASASLNTSMTIEAWIYVKCNNANSTHILTKGWCGSNWSYYFSLYNKRLRIGKWHPALTGCAGNQALFESADSIEVNTWTHVAVVVDGVNVTFYINGEDAGATLLSGINIAGFHTSNQPLRISNYVNLGGTNTGTIKGNIDDVRLWHTARTQAEIQGAMNDELTGNEPGLYAYWKLNESGTGAGIVVANSATATGAATNGTTTGTAANLKFVNNAAVQNDLPTCDAVLWLKADSAVYTNAGITLAADGQSVQQWNDVSGNAFNCSQADVSKRPIWQANAFYGKPAIWFDGVNGNYWLENAVNTPVAIAGNPRTYFVVAKASCDATGYKGGHLFTNRRSPNASTLEFVENGAGIYHGGNFCCNHPEVTNVPFAEGQQQPFIGSWRTNGTGTNLDFWFNGVSKITANANFVSDNGNTGYCVGDRRDAFQYQDPNGAYDWQGHIAEIIVYSRAISNNERIRVENYLKNKYKNTGLPGQFTALPSGSNYYNTTTLNDAVWEHSFNVADPSKIIASVKSNCLALGTRNDTVYVEPTAGMYNGQRYMRRHYVISTSLSPAGNKRVRLYYTNADFADLQTYLPSLTNHNQLVVTKYDGVNEDGIYNTAGGTITFIPSALITTGVAFGQHFLEFDVTGFSEFWIHTGNAPLPLDLLSFHAIKENMTAVLKWKTANMKNVSGFEIEKSNDAKSFKKIGFVAVTEKTAYTFTDENLSERNNYYRLKITDQDTKYTYSETVLVLNTGQTEIILYPNPAKDELNILSSAGNFSYHIYDMYGKEILSGLSLLHNQSISCRHMNKGIYFITVKADNDTKTLRFIKE